MSQRPSRPRKLIALVRKIADRKEIHGPLVVLRRRFAGWETRRSPDGAQAWLNWIVRARADARALTGGRDGGERVWAQLSRAGP
ncbi:MAG: hypothetical protein QOH72_2663 [Solirubrobacteraceae bacterium]|jgi:hypothetical protein|nr:hypothetical protein [Solirubrobacteraceae bacterium]